MEHWDKINAVQRMQEYIGNHLTVQITMQQLAKAAGYSPYYSARIFKELIGKTQFEYIREYRLSQAALQLQDENKKIIDVAFDFAFDSHEGFTKAFSKQFGISPKQYSKHTPPVKLFIPYAIRDRFLRVYRKGVCKANDQTQKQKGDEQIMTKKENVNTVFVQVVDRPARKLILKRGVKAEEYFAYCEEVGCDAWGILSSIKEALYEPIGMWMPKKLQPAGTSYYTQGVEVSEGYTGIIPDGFEMIDLPPCKMMIFQGQPYEDEEFEEAIGDLWEVMKNYNPALYGFRWADEDAPRFQLAPEGYRGYIEARPVRELNK